MPDFLLENRAAVTQYAVWHDTTPQRKWLSESSSTLGTALVYQDAVNKISMRTPNFKIRERLGELPVNSFSYARSIYRLNTARNNYKVNGNGFTTTVSLTNSYPGNDFGLQFQEPVVKPLGYDPHPGLKLRMNLKIKEVKVDIGVMVGERKASIETLANLARRVVGMFEAVRKRDPVLFYRYITGQIHKPVKPRPPVGPTYTDSRGRVRMRRRETSASLRAREAYAAELAVYNNWLAWKYGMKPILMDAEGVGKQLAKTLTQRLSQRVSVSEQFTMKAEESYSNEDKNAYASVSKEVTITIRHKCVVVIDASLPALLSETGLTNPLNIAWNLIPGSFILDWFAPIGNVISNLDVFVGREIQSYSIGVKEVTETTRVEHHNKQYGDGTYNIGYRSSARTDTKVTREPGTPGVVFWAPTPPLDLGIENLFTSLALIRQLSSSPPPKVLEQRRGRRG